MDGTPLIIDISNKGKKRPRVPTTVLDIISLETDDNEANSEDRNKKMKTSLPCVSELSSNDDESSSDDVCSVVSESSDDEIIVLENKPQEKGQGDRIIHKKSAVEKKSSEIPVIDLSLPEQLPCTGSSKKKYRKMGRNSTRQRKLNLQSFKDYIPLLGTLAQRGIFPQSSRAKRNVTNIIGTSMAPTSGLGNIVTSRSSLSNSNVIDLCEPSTSAQGNIVKSYSSRSNSTVIDLTDLPSTTADKNASVFGNNYYNPNPLKKVGLRPIAIDGSNVAMGHGNGLFFSTTGLKICIEYFLKRNHKVIAFVPKFRRTCPYTSNPQLLDELEKMGLISFTPSRRVNGRLIVPYDDRYIVQYAAESGGVIVSTDNFRDIIYENMMWRETIENRLLMFTWAGDILMFPQDPLGRYGPNLDEFLRFPE